ncbi:Gfo/Idh/MocA family oxidoreductase [Catellatospora sp. KI3]|uniref:Gfo/Idh/MocA family protein n=1 Tax=Catellatospora sp. KI3 TaxID=3041620 RepID=UPI0024826BC7|nr:Gfo/Idh/MocA family oxidoreductase [Catellatospora sp. KI3]MDI1465930.1 Gfo/Idh/MocA family oxidoreductase [Catellatospora sp. KI3]
MAEPIRYAVIGRGWRAQFFFKLAALMPDRLQVTGVMTRSAQAGAEVAAQWRLPVVQDLSDLLRTGDPEFVITSVPWDVNPGLVETLVGRGLPVLSETPPAPDVAGLRRLWDAIGATGLVQVAEQYLLLPDHAARLAVLRSGAIGTPTSAQVCSTHGYHAVSILRGMLGVGLGPASVQARAFTAPLADPLAPSGWRDDATPRPATTTLATIDFGDGRSGLYDFTDNQWWNPLRSRRLVVRGSLGELVDDRVVRLLDHRPVESELRRRHSGRDLNLEGFDLDHVSYDGRVVYRNAYAGARLSDEEIAIASILEATGRWCRDEGEPPYPLAQACQDHLLSLAIDESARTGQPVSVPTAPWTS